MNSERSQKNQTKSQTKYLNQQNNSTFKENIAYSLESFYVDSLVYIFFLFMIVVARMDPNVEILREIMRLKKIGGMWRGGDHLHYSLAENLTTIINTITESNRALCRWIELQ